MPRRRNSYEYRNRRSNDYYDDYDSEYRGDYYYAQSYERDDQSNAGKYLLWIGGSVLVGLGSIWLYRTLSESDSFRESLGLSGRDSSRSSKGRSGALTSGKQSNRTVKRITINRPVEQIYDFWRNFENLPQIMSNLESVTVLDSRRSRWKANAPLGMTVEWDAEIIDEQRNSRIAWRSVEGADVDNNGSVRFDSTGGTSTTDVTVTIEFTPPGGAMGSAVAWLFGENPDQQLEEDLQKFKRAMESGQLRAAAAPTIASGNGSAIGSGASFSSTSGTTTTRPGDAEFGSTSSKS